MKRTVTRFLSDVWKGRKRIRIVVLGSAGCGKTVLLTALAGHLRDHDPEAFDLDGWEAYWEPALLPDDAGKGLPPFPYAQYRHEFEKEFPEFPRKTAERSVLQLPLVFKKGKDEKPVLIELMDLPGERVADLVMAHKSYREWCNWMTETFIREKFSASYSSYIKTISQDGLAREDLFKAYKNHLVLELKAFSPWITPSYVKVANGTADGFIADIDNRWLGIDAESQFVPLPDAAFEKGNALNGFVKDFEAAYKVYRKQIVEPIADWLSEADQLVYLVDVLSILKKGTAAYNAEVAFGRDVIGMFRKPQSTSLLGSFVDYLCGLFKTEVKRAFLVATKADLAYGSTGRENMCNLAWQMLGKSLRGLGLDSPDHSSRSCAAVKTVSEQKTARQDAKNKGEEKYEQLVVPEHWPESHAWESSQYWFNDTLPRFDERRNAVPPQMGLDDLVRALLEGFVF